MSIEVPFGWEACRLEEVAKLVRGITFPTDVKRHEPQDGHVACLRTANVQSKVEWDDLWYVPRGYIKSEDQYLRAGDVLISTANSYELVGKVAQVKGPRVEASLGAFIALLRTMPGVSATYFYYLLSSERIQQAIREKASTTTNLSNVSGAKLKQLELPIAPSAEQIRIVEKLEELISDLDAGVAELKAAQQKLQRYRQSLLKAAVEGALTAEWRAKNPPTETGAELLQRILRERRARWEEQQLAKFAAQGKAPPKGWKDKYPEPQPPKTEGLPALPEGWVWASVDQCARDEAGITDGPFGSNLKSEHYTPAGPRVVRLQNIGDGSFITADVHIDDSRYNALAKHWVEDGDVVSAMLGEALPRACAVPKGFSPGIVKADCARIRPNTCLLPSDWLVAALNAEPTRRRVSQSVKGVGRPRINLGDLRSVAVPIPPGREQVEILVALQLAFGAADDQSAATRRALAYSAAQRQNILRAAFRGELVPQDPNDEPASVLLERLRSERNATARPAKAGRKAQAAKGAA